LAAGDETKQNEKGKKELLCALLPKPGDPNLISLLNQ
jgi:hypothetical protein